MNLQIKRKKLVEYPVTEKMEISRVDSYSVWGEGIYNEIARYDGTNFRHIVTGKIIKATSYVPLNNAYLCL